MKKVMGLSVQGRLVVGLLLALGAFLVLGCSNLVKGIQGHEAVVKHERIQYGKVATHLLGNHLKSTKHRVAWGEVLRNNPELIIRLNTTSLCVAK
jgi:hypothetical protein